MSQRLVCDYCESKYKIPIELPLCPQCFAKMNQRDLKANDDCLRMRVHLRKAFEKLLKVQAAFDGPNRALNQFQENTVRDLRTFVPETKTFLEEMEGEK